MVSSLWAISVVVSMLTTLQIQASLECELYIAESTIPNAGIGIFSGVAKSEDEFIGNGDKAIPLIDVSAHNGDYFDTGGYFDPMRDYIWHGRSMGMELESFDENGVSTFWPGIDAMVNSHPVLINAEKANPVYDEGGICRSQHPVAGSISPYNAAETLVIQDIPVGGELFKEYGPDWFTGRSEFGNIPIQSSYDKLLELMVDMVANIGKIGEPDDLLSLVYDDLIKEFKTIWDSRTLNAMHDFTWEEMIQAIDVFDVGFLLQNNATRSIKWLKENGRCIDHILPRQHSTIHGAGSGASAKRDLPQGTIITGTPLLFFPDLNWFEMYELHWCPNGVPVRNKTKGSYGHQLLLNYCYGHPESKVILCPYGSGVNYINHNKTKANVKIQWATNSSTFHWDESLERLPQDMKSVKTKAAFDYVATRDIARGEELFLDYGDAWEDKWNQFCEAWDPRDNEVYVSASNFNTRHEMDPLLTINEQLLAPYPENLSMRCHPLVEESRRTFSGNESELSDWSNWYGDELGYACDVLERNPENESYVVKVETDTDEAVSKRVSNVPRQAIKFADNPYTTDIHTIGAFRQPIGIPDDMLPNAWRRTIDDEENERSLSVQDQHEEIAQTVDGLCPVASASVEEEPRRVSRQRIRGS